MHIDALSTAGAIQSCFPEISSRKSASDLIAVYNKKGWHGRRASAFCAPILGVSQGRTVIGGLWSVAFEQPAPHAANRHPTNAGLHHLNSRTILQVWLRLRLWHCLHLAQKFRTLEAHPRSRGNRLNFRFASIVRWHATTTQLAVDFVSNMQAPAIDKGG